MGILASNPQFVQWVLKAKSNIDSGQFKPMQLATVAALSNSDEWHAGMNRVYRERRDWAEKIMQLLGCSFDPRQVGLFVWGKLPTEVSGSEKIVMTCLKRRVYFLPRLYLRHGERFIRISLGASVEKIQEAYRRIEEYLGNS